MNARGGAREGAGRPIVGDSILSDEIRVPLEVGDKAALVKQAKRIKIATGEKMTATTLARQDIRAGIMKRKGLK